MFIDSRAKYLSRSVDEGLVLGEKNTVARMKIAERLASREVRLETKVFTLLV